MPSSSSIELPKGQAEILRVLDGAPEGLTADELADVLDLAPARVYRLVPHLMDAGLVDKADRRFRRTDQDRGAAVLAQALAGERRSERRGRGLGRSCEWCKGSIPSSKRADAKTCSKRCRQAKHRFDVGKCEQEAAAEPMRFAYADPPYPGNSRRYYAGDEVDHRELVDRLVDDYPDGWALSTSAEALQEVLALCPPGVRVAVWVKGSRHTTSRRALSAWEPLVIAAGRPLQTDVVQELEDVLVARGRYRAYPGALTGMKPPPFSEWLFRQLGARPGDALDDIFPGSGAVGRAWSLYTTGRLEGDVDRHAA